MKRRALLEGAALLALASCERSGGTKARDRTPVVGKDDGRSNDREQHDSILVREHPPQFEPAPFAFAGDIVGRLANRKLSTARGPDWTANVVANVEGDSLAAVTRDAFAVLEHLPQQRIVIIDATRGTSTAFATTIVHADERSRLLGMGDGEIAVASYVVNSNPVIERMSLANEELSNLGSIALHSDNDLETLGSVAHGFVYVGGGTEITEVGFGRAKEVHVSKSPLHHLAVIEGGTSLWASNKDGGLVRLSLEGVGAGESPKMLAEAEIGGVYHLATAGEGAVALVLTLDSGWVASAELVVVDGAGKTRWQTSVAQAHVGRDNRWKPHWVAGSAKAVALGTQDGVSLYDTKTGKPLGAL